MTSVARRSGPARHAGAEAYPGPHRGQAPRPAPSRPFERPPARPVPARPANRPARVGARGVLAVIIAGAVLVIALWWHSTPGVHGLGGWLTGAGEVLGLLCGYGVVVLVALMARLPPLERGLGTDKLARWHAMGGRYIVSLVVAHGLLIVWGYAATAHANVVSESATLLTQYPDVLMATVAGFLLLGIGIVSMRAARRRVRYETWYFLHLYTYLAIALAFSHQLADGAAFVSNLAARFWWSAMYLTVLVLVLWYRFAVPLLSYRKHRFEVLGVKAEGPGVISVYIGGRRFEELDAEPGQFFRWRFLTRSLWWSSHPFSLSAAPGADVLRITVKNLGDHSQALAQLQPGTRDLRRGTLRGVHPRRFRSRRGAAGRRGRHHPAAGHLRHAARPRHPDLPGQQRAGPRVPRGARRDRGRARRDRALPGRVAGRDRRQTRCRRGCCGPWCPAWTSRKRTSAGRPA